MEIVRTDGVERLTIRGLSARLGVAVTAVYWHVGDKQALLDGVVDRIIEELGEVTVEGRTAEDRVLSIGRSLRASLLARPDLVALVHRQGRTASLFQPARRVLVHELTEAGLAPTDASWALQAILGLVVGSVLVDRQVERSPAQRQRPEELWETEDLGADPEADELLAELSRPIPEADLFEYSLGIMVRAVLGR